MSPFPKPDQGLTEVSHGRSAVAIECTCGPFNGRRAVGKILGQSMDFVSQPTPVHRSLLSASDEVGMYLG